MVMMNVQHGDSPLVMVVQMLVAVVTKLRHGDSLLAVVVQVVLVYSSQYA